MTAKAILQLSGEPSGDTNNLRISGGQIEYWNEAALGPQPTPQQIADVANDVTAVDGVLHSAWLEEHGGDALKTLRRKAREALNDNAQASAAVDRAIVIEILGHMNAELAAKLEALQGQHDALLAWLGGQTTLTNRAQLNGFASGPAPMQPTLQQARNAIVARIDAGEADS